MEIYSETGKTKSGILRITKSIGALLITSDQPYSGLVNEKITIHIERSNGSNEEIATNITLLALIGTSVLGEGKIIDDGAKFSVIVELAFDGAIELEENESIIIALTDLKAGQFYTLNGIEMPVQSDELLFLTEKVMLDGQKNRTFEVVEFDEAYIIGEFEKIRFTYPTDEGNQVIELLKNELRGVSADLGLIREGNDTQIANTVLSVVGVSEIEIFADNQVNIVLRDINKSL